VPSVSIVSLLVVAAVIYIVLFSLRGLAHRSERHEGLHTSDAEVVVIGFEDQQNDWVQIDNMVKLSESSPFPAGVGCFCIGPWMSSELDEALTPRYSGPRHSPRVLISHSASAFFGLHLGAIRTLILLRTLQLRWLSNRRSSLAL
jgi:hypothetical protein